MGVTDGRPQDALKRFKRLPRWMWRNTVIVDFIHWLREHNKPLPEEEKVHFFGLDLYSLFESAHEVIKYLSSVDPELASLAKTRYGCFDRYGMDTHKYGLAAALGRRSSCQNEVTKMLVDLLKRYAEQCKNDGYHGLDETFYAKQNAKVVKDAEEYYRKMFTEDTWNLRDKHMSETLYEVLQHLKLLYHSQTNIKAAVWAHNSHLGDASATESSRRGETNIGQLVRQAFGLTNTFNIGFTTFTGTVAAATEWDWPMEVKTVNPGLKKSYEEIMHKVGIPRFYVVLRSNSRRVQPNKQLVDALREEKLERAIGVIYRPDTERLSHYFFCNLSSQFDSVIHIDNTSALTPLDTLSGMSRDEEETFPSGV